MKTGVAKEVVERMMIAEAKHLYPRRREGRAFVVEDRALLGSTYSYHLVTQKTGAAQSSAGADRRRREKEVSAKRLKRAHSGPKLDRQ